MAFQEVNIGVEGNDGTGDSIRQSFRKVNENFNELYAVFNEGGRITLKDLDDTPTIYQPNSIFLVNSEGVFIDNAVLETTYSYDQNGEPVPSVTFQFEDGYTETITNPNTNETEEVYTPGKLIISAGFSRVADDTMPKLGGPLNAAGFPIVGATIDELYLNELNNAETNQTNWTLENFVITKGYADQRYLTSDIPIIIADEPTGLLHYTWQIADYIQTEGAFKDTLYIVKHFTPTQTEEEGHGISFSQNGTEIKFNSRLFIPEALKDPETNQIYPNLYIRVASPNHLWLYLDKAQAKEQNADIALQNKMDLTGASIYYSPGDGTSEEDIHTITLAALDTSLTGNFLSNQAVPRKSLVLRSGDTMSGPLYLSDHPGDLKGSGTPNGEEDLLAATKLYVDQGAAYSSPEVLYVSTAGDDQMLGVPAGREGTAEAYAFKTIGAAAARAAELIKTADSTPGPYIQKLTYTDNLNSQNSVIIGYDIEEATDTNGYATTPRTILSENRTYIQAETIAWIDTTYPDFQYDKDYCYRDIGLLLDAIIYDIYRKIGTNTLSKQAAEKYFSSVSGRRAVTIQQTETLAAIEFAKQLCIDLLNKQLSDAVVFTSISSELTSQVVLASGLDDGWNDGDIISFKDIPLSSGLQSTLDFNNSVFYIKFINADKDRFFLYEDKALSTPIDTSNLNSYSNTGYDDGEGNTIFATFGKLYQVDYQPTFPDVPEASVSETTGVTTLWSLIQLIISEGVDYPLIADTNYGRPYRIYVSTGGAGFTDQTSDFNADALPGKVIRGVKSEAIGRIIRFVNNSTNTFGNDLVRFDLNLLSAKDFEEGEALEFANYIKKKEVVIRVEAGNYYEDYPIKVSNNVSIKGDEFRRVIVQPKPETESHKPRLSQSKWANTYFYRDRYFDGLEITTNGTSKFYNQTQDENIVDEYQGWFGYHYLTDPSKPLNVDNAGSIVINNLTRSKNAANIIQKNTEFLKDETIGYLNYIIAQDNGTLPTNFTYDIEVYKDILGLVIKAIAYDFEYSGKEKVLEAQGFFFGEVDVDHITAKELALDFIKSRSVELLSGIQITSEDLYSTTEQFLIFDEIGSLLVGEDGCLTTVSNSIDLIKFSFDASYNPPKRADEMDCFLLGDTTIIRNLTCRGHGGFMTVLDPDGQILTKSPYIQTASSFSKSINAQTFSGGMLVDAYVGNLPARILPQGDPLIDVQNYEYDPYILAIISDDSVDGQKQGLRIREPQLPCPFYLGGIRYQVNAISDYNQASGFALIYLDKNSGPDNPADPDGPNLGFVESIPAEGVKIFLQTAGNRSLLGNDYTQVNDLGYGLVVTNGAFSEMVSMFTYYCHAAYYSCNGGEIRSLNGSNGYGNFALVSEGADPNEIPDRVELDRIMCRPASIFADQSETDTGTLSTTYAATFEDSFIIVYNMIETPQPDSVITIDHGGVVGVLNYRISAVSCLSALVGDYAPGTIGAADPTAGPTVIVRNKTLYRLELRADDVIQTDYFGLLQTALAHGTPIEYRDNIDLTFKNVARPTKLVTRPSTAINIDESSNTTYRSLDFQTEDPFGTPLSTELIFTLVASGQTVLSVAPPTVISNRAGATASVLESNAANLSQVLVHNVQGLFLPGDDIYISGTNSNVSIGSIAANVFDKARATIEQNFETVQFESFGQQTDGTVENYMDGGCGSSQNDTRLAIKLLGGPGPETDSNRIKDPTSPKVFTFKGKTHRITDYFADVTALNISPGSVTTSINEYIANGPDGAYTALARVAQNKSGSDIIVCEITGTFNIGDPVYRGVSIAALASLSTTIQNVTAQEYGIITFTDASINLTNVGTGLVEGIKDGNGDNFNRIFAAGLDVDAAGEITIAISLVRATGHDFTQIGTGGYNTSNYPNVILGDPSQPVTDTYWTNDTGFQSRAQVWEKKKGRVFWVSTDQYGFFRVGRFFSVDQGTGSITFGGEVGISNANALGFKKGVTINEFSSDEQFADDSNLAVPTEKSIRGYIKRVLGLDPHNPSNILSAAQRIGPGFLPLNGTVAMEGNLNMGSDPNTGLEHRVRNVANPIDSLDAVNKLYVDGKAGAQSLTKNKNFMIDTRLPDPAIAPDTSPNSDPGLLEANEFIVSTGNYVIYLTGASDQFDDGAIIRNTEDDAAGVATFTGVIIQSHQTVDPLYGSIQKVSYNLTLGEPLSVQNTIGGAIYSGSYTGGNAAVNGQLLPGDAGGSFEEVTNAGHFTGVYDSQTDTTDFQGNDIFVTVEREKDFAAVKFAIREDSIVNADVNNSAGILQSKLSLTRAKTVANDAAISSQADCGIAAFSSASFTATASGFIDIKSNGISLGDLQQISANRVLGRLSSDGNVSELSFAEITGGGGGLLKSYFPDGNKILYRSSTDNGGAAADWGQLSFSTGNTSSTIVQRDSSGTITGTNLNFTNNIYYNNEIVATSGGAGQIRVGGVHPAKTNFQIGSDYISSRFSYTSGIGSLQLDNTATDQGVAILLGSSGLAQEHDNNIGTNAIVFWLDGAARYKMSTENVGTVENPDIRTQFFAVDASATNPIDLGTYANPFSIVHGAVFSGYSTRSKYADLAENYLADEKYDDGTVLVFGGAFEITITNTKGDKRIAGVVSTNPAHLMNDALQGEHVTPLALQGRVPCKVIGKVAKGDMLVTSAIAGYAIVDNDPRIGTVLGKAVGEKTDDGKGVVEIVVGRL